MRIDRLLGGLSLGLLGSLALACGNGGDDGDGGAGSCVPGQQVVCPCPDSGQGVQVCAADGSSYGPCSCGAATESAGQTESDTEVDSVSGDGTTEAGTCGNGVEDPGECPVACPQDCMAVDDTMGDSSTTGTDSCANDPIFVASIPMVASRWENAGVVGYGAGVSLCQQAATNLGLPLPMEVSVCDYEQVLQAEAAGELAVLPVGTTAWIHRTTVAPVMAVNSAPGVGGRCVDWTYTTNHISDGEYLEMGAGGVPTYFLDGDTFYDGVDTTHTQPGMLECGSQMRSILCCNPPCMPEG